MKYLEGLTCITVYKHKKIVLEACSFLKSEKNAE